MVDLLRIFKTYLLVFRSGFKVIFCLENTGWCPRLLLYWLRWGLRSGCIWKVPVGEMLRLYCWLIWVPSSTLSLPLLLPPGVTTVRFWEVLLESRFKSWLILLPCLRLLIRCYEEPLALRSIDPGLSCFIDRNSNSLWVRIGRPFFVERIGLDPCFFLILIFTSFDFFRTAITSASLLSFSWVDLWAASVERSLKLTAKVMDEPWNGEKVPDGRFSKVWVSSFEDLTWETCCSASFSSTLKGANLY